MTAQAIARCDREIEEAKHQEGDPRAYLVHLGIHDWLIEKQLIQLEAGEERMRELDRLIAEQEPHQPVKITVPRARKQKKRNKFLRTLNWEERRRKYLRFNGLWDIYEKEFGGGTPRERSAGC